MSVRKNLRAGPTGIARISPMLMRRDGLADPRARQTPNVLATSRHTARGALRLDLTSGSLTVNEQMAAIEAWAADITAKLQAAGLMERSA